METIANKYNIARAYLDVGRAIRDDLNNGTTRNTVEAVAGNVGAGCGVGAMGAMVGVFIGSVICPVFGIGTLFGGFIGGVAGAKYGSDAVKCIGDMTKYDMTEKRCITCQEKFIIRRYKGEKRSLNYCLNCAIIEF